jgi:hypothetical protein
MVIDVVVFTPSAFVLHIQGQSLHICIMGDATVPWFGPIPPIGCQGTQMVAGGMTTWQDNGNGRHDDGNGQQGDSRHDNGDGRHDEAAKRRQGAAGRHAARQQRLAARRR